MGIYVYVNEEEKRRIDRMRRFTGRTLSGYVLYATMKQVALDEAKISRQK